MVKDRTSSQKIGLFTLTMVSAALVTSVRNLPTIAEAGMNMIFFAIIALLFYFIPVALVSAELATGWPKLGGIYVWVREALGNKWGFVATWLQWTYMTISTVSMLYFVGGSLAFVFAPSLANNRIFLAVVELSVIWGCTFLNLRGLRMTGLVSSIGFIGGVFVPGLLIIALGIGYLFTGNPIQMDFSFTAKNIIPDFSHVATLVLLVGFMRSYAGIEASAAHANAVINPKKNFPIAILLVGIFGLAINLLGSMSVAIVIPQAKISLVSGIMEAFTAFFDIFNLHWIVPILGFLVAMGQTAGITSWFAGPVKGLFKAAQDGELPPIAQKVNKNGMPSHLLILQGIVISIISTGLLFLPSLNSAFWISVALSMMIYLSTYFLLLLSGLYLRYKHPEVPRAYKIPFGNWGMWVVAGLGMITMVFAFIIVLFPPAQLPTESLKGYMSFLIIGYSVVFIAPFIIYKFKKPSWKMQSKEEA